MDKEDVLRERINSLIDNAIRGNVTRGNGDRER